ATVKGKQPTKVRSPSDPSEVARTEAQQLKIVLRRSRHQMYISQLGGSGTDKGTGLKPGVPDESFDPIPQTPESSKDEGDGKDNQGLRISEEERLNEEEEAEEL
nr:hypothetical protein [Tanacetum cinerariifolium]